MTCHKISCRRVASTLLVALLPFLCFSQEAEKIYQTKYSKLSFLFQPSVLKKSDASNMDGSSYPAMKFTNDFSYQFGVYYNFFQKGGFNVKTGIIAKEFIPKFDLLVSDNDIGYGEEFLLTQFDPYSQFVLSVPIKVDLYLPLTEKLNLSLGAGLNLNVITGANEPLFSSVSVGNSSNGQFKDIFYLTSDTQNSLNFSYEFSAGFNYKTNFALIDLSLYVNNSMGKEYVSGQYQFVNLNQSPNKTGEFSIRNNFYGLSLSISPKKGWLGSD